MSGRRVTGWHVLAELLECDRAALDDEVALRAALVRACKEAGATVLSTQSHRFAPQGVTAVVLLAESHMSIHTWPESGYAAVDVFTCGDQMRPERAVERISDHLGAATVTVQTVRRGDDG